jgi:uncharacterized membrane protein HdeD (DUF308 family)
MHTRRAETFHTTPTTGTTVQPLTRSWWLLLLRGIASILFGIAAFVWPGLTILALTFLYGAFALADGLLSFIAAFTGGRTDADRHGGKPIPTWWLALIGLLGLAAGAVAFLWPGLTALALITIIGAWAVAIGVLEIIGAIWLREELEDEWLLIAAGLLSVLFGLAILLRPGLGALALAWAVGAYALLNGLLHLAFAFRLKRAQAR